MSLNLNWINKLKIFELFDITLTYIKIISAEDIQKRLLTYFLIVNLLSNACLNTFYTFYHRQKTTTTNTLCSCMQTDPVPTSHDRSSNRLLQEHWPTSDWHEGYKISSKNCYQNQNDLFHGWHLSIYVHPNAQCDVTPFSKKCFFSVVKALLQ